MSLSTDIKLKEQYYQGMELSGTQKRIKNQGSHPKKNQTLRSG